MASSVSGLPRVKSERINIRVTEKNKQRLAELVRMSRCSTMTEVVTKALAFWELFLKAKAAGKDVVLRSEGGKEENLVVL